ncbi:hypothetical protein ABPG75_005866 [Micractinium tetrahymenae]
MSQQFPTYNQNPWGAPTSPQAQGTFPQQPAQPSVFVPHQGGGGQPDMGGVQPGMGGMQPGMGGMQPGSGMGMGGGMQPGMMQPGMMQPGVMQPGAAGGAGGMGGGGGSAPFDPFLTGVAGNMLRQQGQSYLQRGQAFMQSKMGFLSGGSLHYHFSITPEYVRTKLLMLAAPFLKRWSYARIAEQISGGHKYLPPRQDANAPDLYLPVMALWTYAMLIGVATFMRSGPAGDPTKGGVVFRPDTIYNAVSSSGIAWLLHTLLLKFILYMLGISGAVPLLELAAYAGYAFVPACASLLVQLLPLPGGGGGAAYHVVWAYGSLCIAIFLVRTLKRAILQESRAYSINYTSMNYLLLGLAIFQFPLNAWLARLPPVRAATAGAAAAGAMAAGRAAASVGARAAAMRQAAAERQGQ